MKEININIEGYNVNGICVGCLNYNRRMFCCNEVKECFKLLGNIDVPDGLTVQVCWECFAAIRTVKSFQEQILKSYDILYDYSKKYMFLNSPKDLTKHATSRLVMTPMELTTIQDNNSNLSNEVQVKIERENGDAFVEPEALLNEELKLEKDQEEDCADDFQSQDAGVSSEEDVNLLLLKEEKEKQEKKKRKKNRKMAKPEKKEKISRKLKNLPVNQVELCHMQESEMWVVRKNDVQNEYFQSLKYKCSDCLIGFNTARLMCDHMEGKHRPKGAGSHKCDVCNVYLLTKDNLLLHRSLHQIAYMCVKCAYKTTVKKIMSKHLYTHNEGMKEEYVCSICGSEFGTKSKLNYHKAAWHQEKPQCDCCGKVFASKMTLKYHLRVVPQNKEEKPKEKLYIPCKGCSKVFHSKKSYRAHAVVHSGMTYPCPICGKLFQWKRNLARHTRNHREKDTGAVYECRECNKTFASRDCYANHLRLSKKHAPPDSYVHECSFCGKKFATKWCMVDHVDWEHLKIIKYQCSVCFKAFKTSKILVAHVNNIHGGKKKEEESERLCDICGKSYKTEKRLKGHVWAMHTKRSTAKSFKCKLCPATFTWQTSIYKHMKMMHDSKRNKQTRSQPVKKEDPYPGIELANRDHYFQQNINLMQNIVQSVHVQPLEVVHNLG
ncbi:zinc finger protein 845-like [Bombyx mandarina]|uniref:Zinc finger protein 845-like n=1 Tax=Bombyx mandarina TaxID=7092 RepID=A0A6J2KF02_BOMMA|nr:zinc finger protein 845-like [Bombyx mandarina]